MKRAVIFVILFSMVLHCSIRLGIATWLYQSRLEIAYTLGLIDEPPITVCSYAHDFDRTLAFNVSADDQNKMRGNSFQVSEINLFLSHTLFSNDPQYSLLRENYRSHQVTNTYSSPDFGIFHPPA